MAECSFDRVANGELRGPRVFGCQIHESRGSAQRSETEDVVCRRSKRLHDERWVDFSLWNLWFAKSEKQCHRNQIRIWPTSSSPPPPTILYSLFLPHPPFSASSSPTTIFLLLPIHHFPLPPPTTIPHSRWRFSLSRRDGRDAWGSSYSTEEVVPLSSQRRSCQRPGL